MTSSDADGAGQERALLESSSNDARDPQLNVRMAAELQAGMVARAAADGLRKSAWAREVLTAVLVSELSLPQLTELVRAQARAQVAPPVEVERPKLGAQVVRTGRCLHPVHLRQEFPTFDRCVCGVEFRR